VQPPPGQSDTSSKEEPDVPDATDRRIVEVRHFEHQSGVDQYDIRYADGTVHTANCPKEAWDSRLVEQAMTYAYRIISKAEQKGFDPQSLTVVFDPAQDGLYYP
jgi:hypothetical protein